MYLPSHGILKSTVPPTNRPDMPPGRGGTIPATEERPEVTDYGSIPEDRNPIYAVGPALVKENDWPSFSVPELVAFVPRYPVSIVVPYYNAPARLARTLAGLERQTYPRELFEVIVVDDGSDPPLRAPSVPLSLRVVHQPDLGYRLAEARNRGARVAEGDIVIFLDCDMIPEEEWIAAHARWHHAASDVISQGFRYHVEPDDVTPNQVRDRAGPVAELFKGREVTRPKWVEDVMDMTADLTRDRDDIFKVITGGNLGISKPFFEEVGGFDPTFDRWGAEDREFGYRALARGALLVPERRALAWHQGAGASLSTGERQSLQIQNARISHLVPHPAYRRPSDGRVYQVPGHIVTLRYRSASAEVVHATASQVLSGGVHDLVLWIEEDPDEGTEAWLKAQLEPDPRVRFGPPGGAIREFPITPYHITIECGAEYDSGLVRRLRANLGQSAHGIAEFPDGPPVTIYRSWAWHRTQRTGTGWADVGTESRFHQQNRVPEEFEELVARLDQVDRKLTRHDRRLHDLRRKLVRDNRRLHQRMGSHDQRFREINRRTGRTEKLIRGSWLFPGRRIGALARKIGHAARRGGRIRSIADAKSFARWAYFGIRKRFTPTSPEPPAPPPLPGRSQATYSLGADIAAIGPRAKAVFAASGRVRNQLRGAVGHPDFPYLGERHLDLLVVDTPATLDTLRSELDDTVPTITLDGSNPMLSVPAFDHLQVNPIGWVPEHSGEVWQPAGSGSEDGTPWPRHPAELRAYRQIECGLAGDEDPIMLAGHLVAAAAAGVPVRLTDRSRVLERYLGSALFGLMTEASPTATDDDRELASISMRREALRSHSLRSRADQVLDAAGLTATDLPEVSILLPTRRPAHLDQVARTVRDLDYPRLELVLGLHGPDFGHVQTGRLAEFVGVPIQVLRIDEAHNLGEALNLLSDAAGGTLLSKMDDDDHYAPEHILDLVLAHGYSGAELVAKASQYVYLEAEDKTVRLADRRGERYVSTRSVSGGVVMISRHDLAEAGGWRRMPRQIDLALAEDVLAAGGRIYWTHGRGYLRVRHSDGHTWNIGSSFFLDRAEVVREGFDHRLAGIPADRQ